MGFMCEDERFPYADFGCTILLLFYLYSSCFYIELYTVALMNTVCSHDLSDISEDFSEDAYWEDVYVPQLYSFNGLSKGSWKSQRQSLQHDSRHAPVSLHAFNT